VLHEGLERIGGRAFFCCVSLTAINIPSSVERIEYEAFQDCRQLQNVVLHEGVKEIDEGTFKE